MAQQDFAALAEAYEEATAVASFTHMMASTEEYRALVALGPAAVPLILRRLRSKGGVEWFVVLEAITGEQPLPPDVRPADGVVAINVSATRKAWLRWGKERGHV